MDRSAVKSIVDREIEPLMVKLGIPHWRIVVKYEPVVSANQAPSGFANRAQCTSLPMYERATITIDPAEVDDASEVIECLIHELLHVVLLPFDLYRKFATALIPQGSSHDSQEDDQWRHAVEMGVRNLERMFLGLTGKTTANHVGPEQKIES